jgi:hypothetical protein
MTARQSLRASWFEVASIGWAAFSPSRRSLPLVLSLAVLGTLPSIPAVAQCKSNSMRPSGFVFIVEGTWSRANGTLHRFDSLCPGDEIRFSGAPGQSLTIILYNQPAVPSLHCPNKQPCEINYKVPQGPASSEGGFQERLKKAWDRLSPRELDLVAVPAVRGSGPREAVLAKAQGSVDLAPALAKVRPGRYSVELRRWSTTGPSAAGTMLDVVWRRPSGTILSGDAPPPGLYQMELADRAGTVVGGALVLLASQADFVRTNQAFDQIRALADKWEEAGDEVAARRLQVESLLAIARDPSVVEGRQ